MMKYGAALVRLSGTPHGCDGLIEEFYVVVAEGLILPTRYKSYAEAIKHCEKLCTEAHANVA